MALPFRYQFSLAPLLVVVVLAILVAYTLFELSNINRKNDSIRHWELINDRVQGAIAGIIRLESIIDNYSNLPGNEQNDDFFNYLEQSSILAEILANPVLREQLPPELDRRLAETEFQLRGAEYADPMEMASALTALLPLLQHQHKIFSAYRRTAFIENHKGVVKISARLTDILITSLAVCILLATGLSLWGLQVTRGRLNALANRAQSMCSTATADSTTSFTTDQSKTLDELDRLENYLVDMGARLTKVSGVENILQGAEEERRRIAMDMHDGVLADLTAVNRRIDTIKTDDIKQVEVAALRHDIDLIIGNLRGTIDDLHPQILEVLGLGPAIEMLLHRNTEMPGFPTLQLDIDRRLDDFIVSDHKIHLFRILSESINNVIKHAHCDRLEVSLRVVTQDLVVTVEDNGVGMSDNFKIDSRGCANIMERADLIGAEVQWRKSRFTHGTCFELALPLSREKLTHETNNHHRRQSA